MESPDRKSFFSSAHQEAHLVLPGAVEDDRLHVILPALLVGWEEEGVGGGLVPCQNLATWTRGNESVWKIQ